MTKKIKPLITTHPHSNGYGLFDLIQRNQDEL